MFSSRNLCVFIDYKTDLIWVYISGDITNKRMSSVFIHTHNEHINYKYTMDSPERRSKTIK